MLSKILALCFLSYDIGDGQIYTFNAAHIEAVYPSMTVEDRTVLRLNSGITFAVKAPISRVLKDLEECGK